MQVYLSHVPVFLFVQSAFLSLLPYISSQRPVFQLLPSLNMRFVLSIIGLAAFAIMVSAQAKVMKKITFRSNTEWMKKLANRTQGCTKDNVGVRREWLVYITR